jgi:chlorite dismutase
MIDYSLILFKKYPNYKWVLEGESYDGLIWNSNSKKPTKDELDSFWDEIQKEQSNISVNRKRIDAYRNESDPLFFKAQRGEATMQEWQAKVAEIKARFPKG